LSRPVTSRPAIGNAQRTERTAAIGAAIVLMVGFSSFLLFLPVESGHAEALGTWTPTTSYVGAASQSCVVSGTDIYCVGGNTPQQGAITDAYYASLSTSGIGAWTQTTSFPQAGAPVCVASGGYIYCLGPSPGSTTPAYYAPLSPSGIGQWIRTTSFPSVTVNPPTPPSYTSPLTIDSCAVAQSYIYCVSTPPSSGFHYGQALPDLVYYATISSSGIGVWTQTTTYPSFLQGQKCVTVPSAVSGSEFMYCIGGAVPPYDGETETFASGTVEYAPILSTGGLGTWSNTTSYPLEITGQSCIVPSSAGGNYIYCIAGQVSVDGGLPSNGPKKAVYYAQVAPQGGISGGWIRTTDYPVNDSSLSCVPDSGYAYCVGGQTSAFGATGAAYYAQISSPSPSAQLTVTTHDATGNTITGYYTLLYDSGGNLVATGFSPVTFTLNSGQDYTVRVDDYGSCRFSIWRDTGSPSPSRVITITGGLSVDAVYDCSVNPSTVSVNSIDQNGMALFGYYAVLYDSSGDQLQTGFTTHTFSTTAGQTYSLLADSFGSCTFTQWSDGSRSNPISFTASSDGTGFTAEYSCFTTASRISVFAVTSDATPIAGYYVSLWQNGAQLQSCFSPCSFTVNGGQTYQVLADSYASETFSHWKNDGATGLETVNVPSSAGATISLVAAYTP
jgi:hypothetical protein